MGGMILWLIIFLYLDIDFWDQSKTEDHTGFIGRTQPG
jgi:hypothetical protein